MIRILTTKLANCASTGLLDGWVHNCLAPAPYPENAERCHLFGHRETPVAGLHKRAILIDRMAGAVSPAGRSTPTSASWLNAVQGFFVKLTRRRLKRGVFRSVVDLQFAINRFVAETNADPKPFV